MTDIIPFTDGNDAEAVRANITRARADLTRNVATLKAQTERARADMERQRKDLEAAFRRQQADLEAQMAPLEAQLKKMREVMWTVDLYLGRDEHITMLRDGTPAPADTPISIRQKVLVMAEESLLYMDSQNGMNYRDVGAFTKWLMEAPENLNRILPEPKGAVVLVPTRVKSKSGNMFEDAAVDAANSTSHWLLRNGDRLYLLTTEIDVRDRLLPRRDEFTAIFDQALWGYSRRPGEPVKPGSAEWLRMEAIAGARKRHYMRIMLVLQGIIDRTPVWRPLPASGVSLLNLADQDFGRIVLIQDDDPSRLLGDGAETFAAYQTRLNALLRPGLRVIGNWGAQDFREMGGNDWRHRYRHPRLSPDTMPDRPDPNVPHLIEGRKDGMLVVRFARTKPVWKREWIETRPGYGYYGDHEVVPKNRGSVLVHPSDTWVLPFDLVTVPELERFLASRQERSNHFLSMVPVIKAALAAKRAEAAQEAPFRVLLRDMLLNADADPETVAETVNELVHWWKVANMWSRPLNGDPKHEGKAAREIVAEFQARGRANATLDDAIVAAGRTVPGVIAVAQNRQGKWFAYAPSTPAPAGERVFLDVTPIRKDGTLGAVRSWTRVTPRTVALLNVAWAADDWATWGFTKNPNHYLTAPEREQIIEDVLSREDEDGLTLCMVERHSESHPDQREFGVFRWVAGDPADVPLRPSRDPLDGGPWLVRQDRTPLITKTAYRIEKDTSGVRLVDAGRNTRIPDFDKYHDNTDDLISVPYVKDARGSQPRLVWSDAAAMARVADWVQRSYAEHKKTEAAKKALEAEAYTYVHGVVRHMKATVTAQAKARFVEDYGVDSDDLWPAHAKTLNLSSPVHSRDVWGLVAISLDAGRSVVGKTLGDLLAFAQEKDMKAPGEWHPDTPFLLHGFDDLVVGEPETDETDDKPYVWLTRPQTE